MLFVTFLIKKSTMHNLILLLTCLSNTLDEEVVLQRTVFTRLPQLDKRRLPSGRPLFQTSARG